MPAPVGFRVSSIAGSRARFSLPDPTHLEEEIPEITRRVRKTVH
jgi:hypothetical protein